MTLKTLEQMIFPMDVEHFLKRHWRSKVVHIPGDSSKFEGLFDWAMLSDLLNYKRIDPAYVQCCIDGEFLPPHDLIKELPQAFQGLDDSRIQTVLNQGATLMLARIHEVNEKLQTLCHGLSYEIGDDVISNLCCSWPGYHSYEASADDHALFVIQLEGTKEWHIFKPFAPYEHIDDVTSYLDQVIVLNKGDVLYIPRGIQHASFAIEPSMQLTVGIYPRTLSDVIDWIVKEVKEDPVFGNEIPMGIQRDPFHYGFHDEHILLHLDHIKHAFQKILEDPEMVERFNRFCIGHDDPVQSFQFPFYGHKHPPITEDTVFMRKNFQKFSIKKTETEVSIYVWGKKLTYNLSLLEAIRAVFNSTNFTAKDLLSLEKTYAWDEIHPFLEGLVRWGIIVLCPKT